MLSNSGLPIVGTNERQCRLRESAYNIRHRTDLTTSDTLHPRLPSTTLSKIIGGTGVSARGHPGPEACAASYDARFRRATKPASALATATSDQVPGSGIITAACISLLIRNESPGAIL